MAAIETAPVARTPSWRRIARKIARGVGYIVGGVVVLVVLALAFLHSPWGKSFVRGRIEAKLAAVVNGRVSVGAVDYSLLFRTVTVSDLRIEDATGHPAVALGSLRATLDRGSLVAGAPVIDDLAIDGLAVDVVKHADGTSNLQGLFKPSNDKPPASIRVAHLSVAGSATITNPDGTIVHVRDLALAGSVAARPADQQLDLALRGIAAKLTVSAPNQADKQLALAIDSIALGRNGTAIDVAVDKVAVGVVGFAKLGAHLVLEGREASPTGDKHLAGAQRVELSGLRVDDAELAKLLGKQLLVADLACDVTVSGPAEHLVVNGAITTGGAKLAIDGTIDATQLAKPSYQLAIVGSGLRSDLVAAAVDKPLVETALRIDVKGAGIAPLDLDTDVTLAIDHTSLTKLDGSGRVDIDGVLAKASAHAGRFKLEQLHVGAPGVAVDASGALDEHHAVDGRIELHGAPREVTAALAKAGIALPKLTLLPPRLDVAITATGNIDGTVAVELANTRIAIAGGAITLAGRAQLEHHVVTTAASEVGISGLDLVELARLAGKPPRVAGSLSGSIKIVRDGANQHADHDLRIALAPYGIVVAAKGTVTPTGLVSNITATRARDHAVLATIGAKVPLDIPTDLGTGAKPKVAANGPLAVEVDIARRSLADIAELLPAELRAKLPPQVSSGDVAVHVAIAGTPAKPTGTIDVAASATALHEQQQKLALHAVLASSDTQLTVTTTGEAWLREEQAPIARIAATVAVPALAFVDGMPDIASLRARVNTEGTVDATISVPERDLASLAFLRAKLADFGGKLDGTIAVRGTLAHPALDATVRVHDYPTADGGRGTTTLAAHGTPPAIEATLTHADKLAITATIDAANPDRIAIAVTARAADAALMPLLPAFLAPQIGKHDPGHLRWDMHGSVALVKSATGFDLADEMLAGTLDVAGAAILVPNSNRRWHDIGLSVTAEPNGLRITSLAAHETDRAVADRRIQGSGFVALDHGKPQTAKLSLAAHDWLVFGTPALGPADAPHATADFDLGVDVDLRDPVIAIDATVHSLALRQPERFDRAHQAETVAINGDIIYLDAKSARAGKLPVAVIAPPVPPAPPKHRRAMDIRVHIPQPIRVENAPLDVYARGELTIHVRDQGAETRGTLGVERGTLTLFGGTYNLLRGSFAFTDEHPHGWLELVFDRPLPPAAQRELSIVSAGGGAQMSLTGSASNPKKALGGASNSALVEAMALATTGHAVYTSAPDLPASATVVAPRGDQFNILSFMATNLQHMLFLDHISAYADPYRSAGAYGRIENVTADRYSADQKSRVRAVVRPPTPGRSSNELQVDRLFRNSGHTAAGVGVRAGDRGGGGLGVFLEWSSD